VGGVCGGVGRGGGGGGGGGGEVVALGGSYLNVQIEFSMISKKIQLKRVLSEKGSVFERTCFFQKASFRNAHALNLEGHIQI